jgi:hypothetical protein
MKAIMVTPLTTNRVIGPSWRAMSALRALSIFYFQVGAPYHETNCPVWIHQSVVFLFHQHHHGSWISWTAPLDLNDRSYCICHHGFTLTKDDCSSTLIIEMELLHLLAVLREKCRRATTALTENENNNPPGNHYAWTLTQSSLNEVDKEGRR